MEVAKEREAHTRHLSVCRAAVTKGEMLSRILVM